MLIRNRRGQSGLWGYGISGDLPIVLVRIRDQEKMSLVRDAFRAHAYWRMKGLNVDLVIWNEDDSVYRQSLHESIIDAVATSPVSGMLDRPGGVFVRRGDQMSEDDRALLQAVARVVLLDDAGTLAEQADRRLRLETPTPALRPVQRRRNQSLSQNQPDTTSHSSMVSAGSVRTVASTSLSFPLTPQPGSVGQCHCKLENRHCHFGIRQLVYLGRQQP